MNERPDHPDLIEQYLDGALQGDALASFEQHVRADARLRHQLELQSRIDASLRRRWAPPAATPAHVAPAFGTVNGHAAPIVTAGAARAEAPARVRPHRRFLAAAAAIVIGGLGTWLIWSSLSRSDADPYGPWRTMQAVYADVVAEGFEPEWVCADRAEFGRHFSDHYGQPLIIGTLPADTEALGLSYANTMTRQSTCLLGRSGDDRIIVFIDRIERAPRQPPVADGLNVFRRDLGMLVLYELTPRTEPVLLDALQLPAAIGTHE